MTTNLLYKFKFSCCLFCSLVNSAISAGFSVDTVSCEFIKKNLEKPFYVSSPSTVSDTTNFTFYSSLRQYKFQFGSCVININRNDTASSYSSTPLNKILSQPCSEGGVTTYFKKDTCRQYSINYDIVTTFSGSPERYVSYLDCSGNYITKWISWNTDTTITFCARVIEGWDNTFATLDTANVTCKIDTTILATLQVESCADSCVKIPIGVCYNPVTDTFVNPFFYGLLGNFRPNRSYTYYTSRAETDPLTSASTRTSGTFADFTPFWTMNAGKLTAVDPETTNWVWNSEITLFNKKGAELENKDPLGRYNAGMYGYGEAMPVAVVQNSRMQESGFDGFEDYNGSSSLCEEPCPVNRSFGFNEPDDKARITNEQSHTGLYSIKLTPNGVDQDTVKIGAVLTAPDANPVGQLNVAMKSVVCTTGTTVGLEGIRADQNNIIPGFSPLKGKELLVSMWVKEIKDCKCSSYVNNEVIVVVDTVDTYNVQGSAAYSFKPTGIIIEGWQRYEGVVNLPLSAVNVSVMMIASGSSPVYFDDLRIHPFNANMKSFVYDPVTLRLTSELDENNYATFYEYDDDGTLVRVKKETERGVKTIKETRSGLLKE